MIKYKIDYTEPKNVDGWSEARPYLPHIMLVGEVHSLIIPVSNLNGKSRPKLELFEVMKNYVFDFPWSINYCVKDFIMRKVFFFLDDLLYIFSLHSPV